MLRDERFYPSFRQNALYVRMLAELDMLKDPSFRGSDDGDGGKVESACVCLSVYSDYQTNDLWNMIKDVYFYTLNIIGYIF